MRSIRLTPEAEARLADQLDYLIDRGAVGSAQVLKTRVETFPTNTLAFYPRTGRFLSERDLWETWIPGTRLVVWYVFDDNEIAAITFWHRSQDRPKRPGQLLERVGLEVRQRNPESIAFPEAASPQETTQSGTFTGRDEAVAPTSCGRTRPGTQVEGRSPDRPISDTPGLPPQPLVG